MCKMLIYFDRNGIVYMLDWINGDLILVDKMDDMVNWVKEVQLDIGLFVCDLEFGMCMDYKVCDICFLVMGYYNQGYDSYDLECKLFMLGINYICMDWEFFMLFYCVGQFFVGVMLIMYLGFKGDWQNVLGLGQIKVYDVIIGEMKWDKMEWFVVWGGIMVMVGGLIFYGMLDGFIKVCDSDMGDLLWKFKLFLGVIGYLMIYKYDGC